MSLFHFKHTCLYFGNLLSDKNSPRNPRCREKNYSLSTSSVRLYFDRYSRQGSSVVKDIVNKLGTGERIYHITLSPELLTATQVASGYFDSEYRTFFEDVKKYNMKVIFRTMHEMNGGWYAR